jgi:hypothetical protein
LSAASERLRGRGLLRSSSPENRSSCNATHRADYPSREEIYMGISMYVSNLAVAIGASHSADL